MTSTFEGLTEDLCRVVELKVLACVTGPDADAVAQTVRAALLVCETHAVHVTAGGANGLELVDGLSQALHLGVLPRDRRAREDAVLAELVRQQATVVIDQAQEVRPATLEGLFGLWKWATESPGQEAFPMVLTGDETLRRVLDRPTLASLNSYIYLSHRLDA